MFQVLNPVPRLTLFNVIRFIQLSVFLLVSWTIQVSSAAGTTGGSRTIGHHDSTHSSTSHTSSATSIIHDKHSHHNPNDEGYWREVKAIIGGVLGFWGGVGSLGTLFLVIVLSQRYCCRKDDDKDEADG